MFFYDSAFLPLYIITGIFMLVGIIVSGILKSRMHKYSQIQNTANMTGKDVAEKMLRDNGIYDVKVIQSQGFLTDHYNPKTKTIALSDAIYNTPSVAAAAVAAHETGHAIQHAHSYAPLKLRSALVPAAMASGFISQILLTIGVLMLSRSHNDTVLIAGICLFAVTTLFTVITLPVEVDASRRALIWVQGSNIARGDEYTMARDGLRWAALTYFLAALQSIVTLLYYISLLNGRRDR